ncbi:MAG: DNA repair protein RecN [SAR324 cluster bacterium]|nr:DNA repair protein RecN [SAR324 cluster bacterium]
MLQSLKITNLATIRSVELELESGFSILTGETGAGKSIIIDAIHFVTGKKADYSLIRSGESQASVEACFSINKLNHVKELLSEAHIPFESELIIRRILQKNNRQKILLNDVTTTRIKLEEIGKLLVNIHGQHANQALLQIASHIDFLDAYGQLMDLRSEVKELFAQFQQALKAYEKFTQESREKIQQIEELSFQKSEIEQFELQEDEEETLTQENQILSHSAKLSLVLAQTQDELYDRDSSLTERLGLIKQSLEEAVNIDPDCARFLHPLEDCLFQIEDLRHSFSNFSAKYQENPERLEWINQRLSQIQTLKRKYGNSIPQILEYLQQISGQLDLFQNAEETEKILLEKMNVSKERLNKKSRELSSCRHQTAKILDQKIVEELHQLGMEKARFETKIHLKKSTENREGTFYFSPNGMDEVEFLISVNPGQELKSLVKVASGGELSRIMLALKTILVSVDGVETMIFDEIDSGISGRTAEMVGYKLRTLGQSQQTLCVTHLPQIVAFSEYHFVISKTIQEDTTLTSIQCLAQKEKVQELARLMGGSKITPQTLGLAAEMLEHAKQKMTP